MFERVEDLRHVGNRPRFAVKEPLALIATDLPQEFLLRFRFDAFRSDRHAEARAEPHDGANDRLRFVAETDAANERSVRPFIL